MCPCFPKKKDPKTCISHGTGSDRLFCVFLGHGAVVLHGDQRWWSLIGEVSVGGCL